MNKNILIFGIISLFFISAVTPITLGYNVIASNKYLISEDYNFDSFHVSEIYSHKRLFSFEETNNYNEIELKKAINIVEKSQSLDGPMDSAWPMYCHDVHHTGRSPFITADNTGDEKWRSPLKWEATGGISIDNNGTIYIGGDGVYAVYPNGTQKWKFTTNFNIFVTPAIDEDGTIYAGIIYGDSYLFALNPSGTLKWKYITGESIFSSPAIGNDGTIYFGCEDYNIYALYPNGTLKWKYKTDNAVLSSPVIGDDGTIYCGSHDNHLYALYPNGSLKWKYGTGHWVRVSPCIADDGTIYIVSLDYYLHAVYPNNGTLKWKTNVGAGTSPTIGQDGTIYAGYSKLYAIYPSNGSVKWVFNPGPNRMIRGATPCNSVDGTIFFGTHIGESDGGEIIALNSDGTEKWRIMIANDWVDSPPAIDQDGTVYVGSANDGYHPGAWGYLHAINSLDPNAPSAPDINGPINGDVGTKYDYNFKSTSPFGNKIYFWIEWGDGGGTEWVGPYDSGEEITLSHKWTSQGTYIIKARAKDTENLWGPWSSYEVSMPRNKATSNVLFYRFLEQFPLLERLLNILL